ncbi:MAG: sigma-E factor negative regulatory protein [Pseudomonadales bacterium]|nr:sigma-E factor negative regulatory protein [Pseudomonadales bacterium]MDP7597423.1 sigma-E factor negative regulatory protein [Pseudomonadales bacterium]HJN50101.1 sigma-E factor negative regulatory protein [Pseudomonadales bacterium]
MADNTKESLSAWLDGEASEIEVHRLLRQVELDAGLKSNWVAYQQIRSVIRQEQRLSAHEHLQLNLRIKAAIEAEPPFADEFGKEQGSKAVKLYKPVAGLAVAASLVAAIFLGVQSTQLVDSGTTNGEGPDMAAVSKPPVADATPSDSSVQTRIASNDGEPFGDESELRELDEEKKKLFRTYVMRHDRLSKMKPYVRANNRQK